MVGHPKWPAGLAYVDLFAGPGVCTIRESDDRVPGSPLIAAAAPKPFQRLLFCELDKRLAKACEERVAKRIPKDRFMVFPQDCNLAIEGVARELPLGALTLAFLDPTGLHLWFETVRRLSVCGAVDLLILFPDGVDILRNAAHLYFDQSESNLDRTLGPNSQWRERIAQSNTSDRSQLRRLYATIYKDQLRRYAGYTHFGEEVIRSRTGPLYRLIYATKHPRGLDFWEKSVSKELRGARLF